jgi:hypothetical protein
VYVTYNLRIHLRQARLYKRDEDPFQKLMELPLYDDTNLIRDWMENGGVGDLGQRPRKDCPRKFPARWRLRYHQGRHLRPRSSFPCYQSPATMNCKGL